MNNYRGPIILDNSTGTPGNPGAYYGFAQSSPTTQRNSTGARFYSGTGNPNGVLTAPIGSLWINDATGIWYQNTDGATTWVPFGSGSGGETLIYDSGYGVAVATLDTGVFAMPPSTQHLKFNLVSRSADGATYDRILLTINGDAVGANYQSTRSLDDPAVGVLTAPIARLVASQIIGSCPATGAGANRFGALEGTSIFNSSTHRRQVVARTADHRAVGDEFIAETTVEWANGAVITQLAFSMLSGANITAGSRLMVYAQ